MPKILIFSDLHVHPHKRSTERLGDCLKSLEWVFETAKERNIDDIVFCGDLFHERQHIDVLTYQKTFNIVEKYSDSFNLYLLLGNHDLWHFERWDVSSVNPFRSMKNVVVIDQPTSLDVNIQGKACKFGFLPYTHNPIKDLKNIEWTDGEYPKLLFGHVAIDGAMWNVKYKVTAEVNIEHDGDMIAVGPEIFDDWEQVFLGHYHAEQVLGDNGNIEYVGSPLELSFGEAFQDKHIIEYDLDTLEKVYIKNEFSPKHLILSEDDIDKYELEGNFIRLEVNDLASADVIEMRNELTENLKVGSLTIKQVQKSKEEEIELITEAKSILYQEDEMLEKYVNEVEIDEKLEKDKLLEVGKAICLDDCT